MSRVVATGDTRRPVDIASSAVDLLAADRQDEVHYAVRRAGGEWLAGDPDVPPVPGAMARSGPTLHSGVLGDELVRVASISVPDPSRPGERVVVQVSETLNNPLSSRSTWWVIVVFPTPDGPEMTSSTPRFRSFEPLTRWLR